MWNGVRDPEVMQRVTVLFEADKFVIVDLDGNRQVETIKLMPDQTPKAIDCSNQSSGQASLGIYSLDGDTLKWCSSGGGNKVRPSAFASTPGSKQSLMVLRRKKS
jgi:uncharacterized protein (TIGR03067 family)